MGIARSRNSEDRGRVEEEEERPAAIGKTVARAQKESGLASNERLSATTLTTVGTKNVIRWHCARRYSSLRWRVHDGTLFIERLAQKRVAHSWLLSNYALATQRALSLLSSPLVSRPRPSPLFSMLSVLERARIHRHRRIYLRTKQPTNQPTSLPTYQRAYRQSDPTNGETARATRRNDAGEYRERGSHTRREPDGPPGATSPRARTPYDEDE